MELVRKNTEHTKIQFLGGLDTIGGNIVCLTKGDYQLIMDFGALVGADILELQDRSHTLSLLDRNLLAKVNGVYPANQIYGSELVGYEDSQLKTLVCISHLHYDHVGSLSQIHPEIPVAISQGAYQFYQQLEAEHLLLTYPVNWKPQAYEQVLQHGPFSIRFFESDHDTIGACSIFVDAQDFKMVYSGDLRLTGFHPEKVENWVRKAREFQPDLLLIEGTSYSFSEEDSSQIADDPLGGLITGSISGASEQELANNFNNFLIEYDKQLVALNGYAQNIERFIEWARRASRLGRKFVFDSAYYQLLHPYDVNDKEVAIYQLTHQDSYQGLDWQVTTEMIQAQPEKYCLQVDYDRREVLRQVPAGIYLHSNGMPLGPYMPEYLPFVEEIVGLGWTFIDAHASGHASRSDLCLLTKKIQATNNVGWHTFDPEGYGQALKENGLKVIYPLLEHTYSIQELFNK